MIFHTYEIWILTYTVITPYLALSLSLSFSQSLSQSLSLFLPLPLSPFHILILCCNLSLSISISISQVPGAPAESLTVADSRHITVSLDSGTRLRIPLSCANPIYVSTISKITHLSLGKLYEGGALAARKKPLILK